MLNDASTIAAIATARGAGGVAVIRVSGSKAWAVARTLFSKPETAFKPGRFYHGWIVNPEDRAELVDEVLLLIFRAPHSFTGEDVVEIHCHGGEYVSRRILDLCFQVGAVPAPPGEFTKRAFLNGKLDLTQAESVMDLVSARGEGMLRMASANLKNRSLGHYIEQMGEVLLEAQALIVASVDFPDEVDEPERGPLVETLDGLVQKAESLEAASQRNRLVREGLKVALLGMPNSGKSSIFNALLASERAIVSEFAGTTRDVITESLDVAGVPVTLVDTAGIRETEHSIEMLGIQRSWQAADEAQAVLYVFDATVGLTEEDRRILSKLAQPHVAVVANKIDLTDGDSLSPEILKLSAQTGRGFPALIQWLERVITQGAGRSAEEMDICLNQRQLACLSAVRESLALARNTLADPILPIDLVTVPLTDALRKLDELMGRDTAEEVLTEVFQRFCVGK